MLRPHPRIRANSSSSGSTRIRLGRSASLECAVVSASACARCQLGHSLGRNDAVDGTGNPHDVLKAISERHKLESVGEPTDCDVCGLMIVSSPHLARSYHRLSSVLSHVSRTLISSMLFPPKTDRDFVCAGRRIDEHGMSRPRMAIRGHAPRKRK
jgi:hypothetical protein